MRILLVIFLFFFSAGYSTGLKGIFFTTDSVQKKSSSKGISSHDFFIPKILEDRLEDFLEQEITKNLLTSIKKEVLSYFKETHNSFFKMELPEQEITDGVITVFITKPKVGKVTYCGQKWFSQDIFEKQLKVKKRTELNEENLLNNLAWLNFNPFHQTNAVFSPGVFEGLTDVEFITKDRFPLNIFAGVDNTGNSFTGHNRLHIGANWGNAFGVNDLFSYLFTSSDNFSNFLSHYFNYTSFLSTKNVLILYGCYATTQAKIGTTFTKGKDVQASFRYKVPFSPLYKELKQEFYLGADYKLFDSQLFFIDQIDQVLISVADPHYVAVSQFNMGYFWETKTEMHKPLFEFEIYTQLINWLPHQTKSAYGRFRPHAKTLYGYARLNLADVYKLPKGAVFSWLLRTQGASGPLLPSEQFGLGGYDTIRGYNEREFNADQAICFNGELRFPSYSFSKIGEVTLLGFLDVGAGHNSQTVLGQKPSQTLCGVGPGLRWNIAPHLSCRLDYGFRLKQTQFVDKFGKVHFSFVGRY